MLLFLKNKTVSHLLYLCLLVLLPILSLTSCNTEKSVDDKAVKQNNKVRIIVLAPHLAELVDSAGAIDNLVGVVAHSDFSHEISDIQIIGDAFKLDYETIVTLNPDYILTWKGGTPTCVLEKLKSLQLNLIETEIKTLDDIPKTIAQIAQLTDNKIEANKNIKIFNDTLTALKNQNHLQKTVFIETYHKPLYTVSGEHWISEAASICGYINVFSALPQLSASVTLEAVINKDPQAILNIAQAEDPQWHKWNMLDAVKNKHIITISPDLFSRPRLTLLEGITQLCEF